MRMEQNPQDERRRLEEDASIGLIASVVAMPLAGFLLENTVQIAHAAEKYGWNVEGTGVVGNGMLTVGVAGLAAWQWRKFHQARDALKGM